ncbi:MAG: DNA translocase FtsK 4TM domain-containing protein, partial [Bacteroidales bacterium]|nr:DNA translocase FtsK 4TM domain-containing protein [Bacteroidales bacterium]
MEEVMGKSKKKQKENDQIIAEQEMAAPQRKDGIYLICGLVSLAIAIYTLIALVSYIFTWAHDQSSIMGNDIFSSLSSVENGGGKIGLWWANLLVSKLFGLGAFIIPFFFFGVALFCLKIKKVRLLRLFFITVFGCILISVLFSFIFSFTGVDRLFGTSAGGSYGYYVNSYLKSMTGVPGTAAILIIAIIGWLIIINKSLIKRLSDGFAGVGQRLERSGGEGEDNLEGDLEGEDLEGEDLEGEDFPADDAEEDNSGETISGNSEGSAESADGGTSISHGGEPVDEADVIARRQKALEIKVVGEEELSGSDGQSENIPVEGNSETKSSTPGTDVELEVKETDGASGNELLG